MANDIQIIVDSSDLQKAVDWMDKMGQSGKKLGTRTKTLQQEFDKYNRKLKQNQAELKRIKMATDPVYAAEILGWHAESELDEMCEDAWRWQSQNPEGYSKYK